MKRGSGILMHISSLPGKYSIGSFGSEAVAFIDKIAECGFTYWQVLPFSMADDCNSPYKSFSAFGGNPYFVSLEKLFEKGLLTKEELTDAEQVTPYSCEFERLSRERMNLLRLASSRVTDRTEIEDFISQNTYLSQFCYFMAHKAANGQRAWYEWYVNDIDENELFLWKFIQYEFFTEWAEIKKYANGKGIKIIGDIPIYVAHDSCDVWANRDQFDLDKNGFPKSMAGCPPDYFSENGQFWGNPLYNWKKMKSDGFSWWRARIKHMLTLFDGVRIDHFRGLASYWSIPAGAASAKEGHWEKGPGKKFADMLNEVTKDNGFIIAEDLGDITPDVTELLEYSKFPGMRVLQFAFLGDPETPHLPHNYINNCIAYTGTHDNNTLLGYIWEQNDSERRRLLDYCGFSGVDWNCTQSYDAVIRTMYASAAGILVMPVQDVLLYGADTRMNIPGKPDGNWRFRISRKQLDSIDTGKFIKLNQLYSR